MKKRVDIYPEDYAFIKESNKIEGINREPNEAEIKAFHTFTQIKRVTIEDMKAYVSACQPNAVIRDREGLNVRVGQHKAPEGGKDVVSLLQQILDAANIGTTKDAYNVHVAYELLHPFTDGNGRSGRMLWYWMRKFVAPLGFLHHFYYEALSHARD